MSSGSPSSARERNRSTAVTGMRTTLTGTVAAGSSADADVCRGRPQLLQERKRIVPARRGTAHLPEPQADRIPTGEEHLAGLRVNSGSMSAFMQIRLTGNVAPRAPRSRTVCPCRLSGIVWPWIGRTGMPLASSACTTWRAASPVPSSERKYPTTFTPKGRAGGERRRAWLPVAAPARRAVAILLFPAPAPASRSPLGSALSARSSSGTSADHTRGPIAAASHGPPRRVRIGPLQVGALLINLQPAPGWFRCVRRPSSARTPSPPPA